MRAFASPPSSVALARALARAPSGALRCLGAVAGGVVVGKVVVDFALDRPMRIPLIAELEVRPDVRRRGIGAGLVRAAERAIAGRGYQVASIAVDDDNFGARRLYLRLGYRPVGQQIGSWVERWPDGRVRHRVSPQTLLARELTRAAGSEGPDQLQAAPHQHREQGRPQEAIGRL